MNETSMILMSTYNGEKYIKQQIDTILNQDYCGKIIIQVRDDGSKDSTIDILESIKVPEKFEIRIIKENNKGPQKSFLELIAIAEKADFYFFADQDDIWDKDKISIATEAMRRKSFTNVAYASNYRLCDMELNIYERNNIKKTPRFSPLKILFYNSIPGCTMGFNNKLLLYLKRLRLEDCIMHDSMTLALASVCGEIIYDPQPRITHRIHENNVVGTGHKKISIPEWIRDKTLLVLKKEKFNLSEMANQYLEVTSDCENILYKQDIELLRDYKKSYFNTIKLLHHKDSHDALFDRTTLSVRGKILFHVF